MNMYIIHTLIGRTEVIETGRQMHLIVQLETVNSSLIQLLDMVIIDREEYSVKRVFIKQAS